MKTLREIQNTPYGLLTEEEIEFLDPEGQQFAREYRAQKRREIACPKHERISTATPEETRRGVHRAKCMHCDKDMSWDSSD